MAHTALMSPLSILLVYGDIPAETTLARAGIGLIEKLQARGFEVTRARSAADGESAIRSDPLIGALIVDADLDRSGGAETVLRAFRARNDRAPAFLFGERSHIPEIPLSTLKLANEFVWLIEEIVTVGTAPAVPPVTVTPAAPDTVASATEVALIVAVPALTPVTLPSVPTDAIVGSLDAHVTVRLVTPASASTDAASVEVPPTANVRLGGETVTL